MNLFSITILLASLQGIFLFFAINRLKKASNQANKFLALFILMVSLTLLGRYFFAQENLSLFELKLLLVGDTTIFLFGPFLYFYFIKLFGGNKKLNKTIHFLPVTVFILYTIPLMFSNEAGYFDLTTRYSWTFIFWEVTAIFLNLFYAIRNFKIVNEFYETYSKKISFTQRFKFYKILMTIILVTLLTWLISFLITVITSSSSPAYHIVWIILSAAVISLGYYSINYPEIFTAADLKGQNLIDSASSIELQKIGSKLKEIMEKEKPYLNPKLTLDKLADIAGITPHLLSKAINEIFDKNFFLFVNDYRVNEFKILTKNNKRENYTILALAYDSGFNSKTTFNTAFKKVTNLTPKEYLNNISN